MHFNSDKLLEKVSLSPGPVTSRPTDMPTPSIYAQFSFTSTKVDADFDAAVQTNAISGQIAEQYGIAASAVKSTYAYVKQVDVDVTADGTAEEVRNAVIEVLSAYGDVQSVEVSSRRVLVEYGFRVSSLNRDLSIDSDDVQTSLQSLIPGATASTTVSADTDYEATFVVDSTLSTVSTASVQDYLEVMYADYNIAVVEESSIPTQQPSEIPTPQPTKTPTDPNCNLTEIYFFLHIMFFWRGSVDFSPKWLNNTPHF